MTLLEFKSLLEMNPNKSFQIRLPGGSTVPEAFHVTEVARIQKTFIDCGGDMHEIETCQLQVWLGGDEDHRLATQKLSGILKKAASFLPNQRVPLEIEYEDGLLSQFTVENALVNEVAVVLQLAAKHTDCLAKELCGIPQEKSGEKCGCGPGCC